MVGDDADPAVPGYDPDISAELYTTNGDIDGHMQEEYGTLGVTPEMCTCETASDKYDDDVWSPDDCESGFTFPDDEPLIQHEFENNIPFALAVALSAADPDDPVSVVGLDTPNFVVDTFTVSYGDPQQVAVTAKQALRGLRMKYQINGGRVCTDGVKEWRGGERYGFENDDYYAEYRGTVKRTKPGDHVEVWFTGVDPDQQSGAPTSRASTSPTPSPRTRATRCCCSPTRTATESTRGRRHRVASRSTSTSTSPRSLPTGSRPTSGTSAPRACRTTSGCSTTTRRSSGTTATTA